MGAERMTSEERIIDAAARLGAARLRLERALWKPKLFGRGTVSEIQEVWIAEINFKRAVQIACRAERQAGRDEEAQRRARAEHKTRTIDPERHQEKMNRLYSAMMEEVNKQGDRTYFVGADPGGKDTTVVWEGPTPPAPEPTTKAELSADNPGVPYLRQREWSMGNGQCPDCYGVPAKWHGHPLHMDAESIGHQRDCPLASCLVSFGEKPLMVGEYKSDIEFERYVDRYGHLGTRPKTGDTPSRFLRRWIWTDRQ